MKIVCILESGGRKTTERRKEKLEASSKEIVKLLEEKYLLTWCSIDTMAEIFPCKYQDCPNCRFYDLCIRLGLSKYSESKKVMIIEAKTRGIRKGKKGGEQGRGLR